LWQGFLNLLKSGEKNENDITWITFISGILRQGVHCTVEWNSRVKWFHLAYGVVAYSEKIQYAYPLGYYKYNGCKYYT
jgi:hypothetical protein